MRVTEQMNEAMRERAGPASGATHLAASLQMLLDAGFVERDGCVFLAAEAGWAPGGELLDATGREALVNHVHIADRPTSSFHGDPVDQTIRCARCLADRLDVVFPTTSFTSLSRSATRLRSASIASADEPPWVAPNLESYENEAVLVLAVA